MTKQIVIWVLATFSQLVSVPVFASEFSAKSDLLDEPFLAYGYNPATGRITGHLVVLRTSPGRTDECKLVFGGKVDNPKGLAIKGLPPDPLGRNPSQPEAYAVVVKEGTRKYLKFLTQSLPGECDWVLPFNEGPRVLVRNDEVLVAMEAPNRGDWIGVYLIGAKKARFHDQPNPLSARKAFVVAGDLVFVYREQADWYFVKFEKDDKKTVGWIKKAHTVQP